jgi:nickel superoxide dismutase
MNKKTALLCIIILCFAAQNVIAHCEIPCGIYDDGMRIAQIREHIATIEKSMKMIIELTSATDKNYNQIVRWINNKEFHSDELQHIVSQYFMTQRIKLIDIDNEMQDVESLKKLALLHSLLVYSMKAKQTLELQHINTMRDVVDEFEKIYFKDE